MSRIAGTSSSSGWKREIATGGDPVGAVVEAWRRLPRRPGGVWTMGISHDDGCPALAGRSMLACTCEIVWLEARRAA